MFGCRNTASGLATYISPDQLPKDLGGTSTCPLSENWGPWTATLLSLPPNKVTDPELLAKPVDIADVTVEAAAAAGPGEGRMASNMYAGESFHTCLSNAESTFLSSFLQQRPASSRFFVPGLGATFRREDVPVIEEETASATRTNPTAWTPNLGDAASPIHSKSQAAEPQPGCCPWLCFHSSN